MKFIVRTVYSSSAQFGAFFHYRYLLTVLVYGGESRFTEFSTS